MKPGDATSPAGGTPGGPPSALHSEALPSLRQRHRRQWLAGGMALLLIFALVFADLAAQRQRVGAEQEQLLRQQLRLLDEVLSRQIIAVNAGLASVVADLPAWAADRDWLNADRRLVALDAAIVGTRTLLLADAQGRVYASSRSELVGLDVAERDYFRSARALNEPERLVVSEPFRTVLGVWSLNLSRAVRDANGRFAGVVSATIDPEWLAVTLGSTNFAPDTWAALAHGGGRLVMMTPSQAADLEGTNIARPGSMLQRHLDSGQRETLFSGHITATGQSERVIVQRTLQPPGLRLQGSVVLALSRDLGAIHAAWALQARNAALLLALLTLLSAGGLAMIQGGERHAAAAAVANSRALLAQEQRWVMALQSSGLGVWDYDPRSGREYHSPQWAAMLGFAPQDVADSTDAWRDRLHPDDRATVLRQLEAHLAGHTPAYEAEYRLRAADGGYRWILARGRVVERDGEGRAQRMIGTITDVTERHEAQALRADRDRAEAASRAKTEFLSRMSHELRTPLNAVLGFAQLLSARLGGIGVDEERTYLRHIEDGGWHLLTMVDEVLDLSRVESGQLALAMRPVALAPLLQTVAETMAPLASRRAVRVRLADLPPGAAVQADPDRLRQVFTNLVSNAVKYNREGGEVVIVVSPDEGAWRVAVSDSGLGIPAAQLAHLFEPFNRLGHQNSAIEGSGLGLVLTRWFVDKMGGRMLVDSREGVGSTFAVVLPRAELAAS